MYVLYYVSMLWCWHLVWILVRSDHPCLGVRCHSTSLQHPAHSYISISHVSLLSPSQHHYSKLNHFRIHFVGNKFEKTN
jgi:hypothetical protein